MTTGDSAVYVTSQVYKNCGDDISTMYFCRVTVVKWYLKEKTSAQGKQRDGDSLLLAIFHTTTLACCAVVDSPIWTRYLKSRHLIILATMQIYNIPSRPKRSVQIACSVYTFLPSGWDVGVEKYDECVLARGEWVVRICQRCYYSRQQSYRPISCTIITIISSRSPYNSSQLSTSRPWQHKHVLTQRARHFTVSH